MRDGSAAAVVASRDPADPHHDLWWAHTGGGAGNFGIVTRCWFRSADGVGRPAVGGAAARAGVDRHVHGVVDLGRSNAPARPPAPQLRRLVRAPRRRRLAVRVAVDAARRPAPAGRAASSCAASAPPATPRRRRSTSASPRSATASARRRRSSADAVLAGLRPRPVPGSVRAARRAASASRSRTRS